MFFSTLAPASRREQKGLLLKSMLFVGGDASENDFYFGFIESVRRDAGRSRVMQLKKRLHENVHPLALYKPTVARQGIEQMLYNNHLEKICLLKIYAWLVPARTT